MIQAKLKRKTCKQCGTTFDPARLMQTVCGSLCAGRLVKAAKKAAKKEERIKLKARREKIKTIPQLIREAQTAFNAYVRFRDRAKPCICCGQPLQQSAVGGGFDAGHYRGTGSASHLRFHEDNCHGQRKHCNRYRAGRVVDYRIGLIARIGLERVEALEHNNTPIKWTEDYLLEVKAVYKSKLNSLERQNEVT